eukprot:CCRYP_014208-RB/>CCRYP_014208-RB protein AED:0.36 eAED:0.36 QI:78/0.75/0.4/1/0.5/0.4/5/0/168
MSSAEGLRSFKSLTSTLSAMIFSWSGDLAPNFPLFMIILQSLDVIMEGSIRNTLKVSIEKYGVNVVNRLALGLELGIIVIEVCAMLCGVVDKFFDRSNAKRGSKGNSCNRRSFCCSRSLVASNGIGKVSNHGEEACYIFWSSRDVDWLCRVSPNADSNFSVCSVNDME